MEPKVDREELAEIVEEAAHIEELERDLVDAPDARKILEELNLPGERLGEARQAVADRHARDKAKTKQSALIAGGVLLLALAGGGLALEHGAHVDSLAAMSVSESHVLTHDAPVGGPLSRATAPEVTFQAVLAHAPHGEPLDLTCDWKGPSGEIERQSHWQTKPVDKDVWPTHCKRTFGASDAPGARTVSLRQGDHELASGRFVVE